MTPVRRIDPDRISIDGRGGQTDITTALELDHMRLRPYMEALQQHPERAEHPLPLVLLFSNGEHNVASGPQPVAEEIKRLNLNGEAVVIAVAGVSVGNEHPDEKTLRQVASPECYVHIDNAPALAAFIASVGSSGAFAGRRHGAGHQADPGIGMRRGLPLWIAASGRMNCRPRGSGPSSTGGVNQVPGVAGGAGRNDRRVGGDEGGKRRRIASIAISGRRDRTRA